MGYSRRSSAPSSWTLLPIIAILVGLPGIAACGASTSVVGPTPTTAVSGQTSPTASTPPSGSGTTDFCTLAIRVATDAGLMVNKHYVRPIDETVDQFKAVVKGSLAARDQLLASVPAEVRPALATELQYFQALQDNNFGATPTPPGLASALQTVNQYQTSVCGVVFDQ